MPPIGFPPVFIGLIIGAKASRLFSRSLVGSMSQLVRAIDMAINENVKKVLTIILALVGMGVMGYYLSCSDSCAYLKGEIFGIDLKYVGFPFMIFVMIASAAGWDALLRMVLAAGIGGEIFLIGYQFYYDIYCPYCLTFAAAMIAIFVVNYRRPMHTPTGWRKIFYLPGDVRFSGGNRTRALPLSLCTAAGFLVFVLAFSGSPVPAYAAEPPVPVVYGSGPAEIRIYSDYFCKPCQVLEDESEALLDKLGGKAGILFVDVPGHKDTALYARYFLYATWTDSTLERAKKVRKLLFSAAKQKIATEAELIKYLQVNGIQPSLCPTTRYFDALSRYIRDDRIRSTPTCIIIHKGERIVYDTPKSIVTGLQDEFLKTPDGKLKF